MVAYYDQCYLTIRHVQCKQVLPDKSKSDRCSTCRTYRYVLRSALRNLHVASNKETECSQHCLPESHTNYRYLDTPEKIERLQNMHKLMCRQKKQIKRLQSSLNKLIQSDGIKVDETTNRDLLHIMNCNTSTVLSAEEKFQSLFWQQQLKASSVKGKQGVRWHPAIIRWCLYLHHRSSGAYSTLRNSGVLKLPSERTLRDYRHFASAAAGFTKENDQQLLDLLQLQKTENLAKYVVITLDEMYIREGLLFDKHSGALIGFADLGNVNNLLAEYEQQHESSNDSFCQRPIAKCMVVFMIRGLFSSLQYVYAQFPAVSTKGHQLFVLLWKVIGRLTRLGFEVLAVTCDGAKNNRKMFSMHVPLGQLPYKTTNIHQSTQRTIYFICDPPHVLKTIRNCFARGKLWVSINHYYYMLCAY